MIGPDFISKQNAKNTNLTKLIDPIGRRVFVLHIHRVQFEVKSGFAGGKNLG